MSYQALREALSSSTRPRILVVGDVMLDDFTFCYKELSKEIPSEKVGKRAYQTAKRVTALGGAANVAMNLTAMGVSTSLIGVVGRDGYDTALRRSCEEAGVIPFLISEGDRPTTIKRRIYLDDDYFFRIDNETTTQISPDAERAALQEFSERIDEIDALVLSDYNKGVFTETLAREMVAACNRRSIPLVVDCKPANAPLFHGAQLVIPNLIEAKALHPEFTSDKELDQHLLVLKEKLQSSQVAVTLGGDGICGFDGTTTHHVPGVPVEVKDCVGAGDTVRAAVALGMTLKLSFRDILLLANVTGALVVQKVGTSSITRGEIVDFLQELPSLKRQEMNTDQAEEKRVVSF